MLTSTGTESARHADHTWRRHNDLMSISLKRLTLTRRNILWGASSAVVPRADEMGTNTSTVRVAAVNTPEYSGLLDSLIATFTAHSGTPVEVYQGNDVYVQAQAGRADLVISHYGKADLKSFVTAGFGQWPLAMFSNQIALVGPPHDPARIAGLDDVGEAFSRIAKSRSTYIVNNLNGLAYLEQTIWECAGRPELGTWYMNVGVSREEAMRRANSLGAYVLWGAFPFLRLKEQEQLNLQLMVTKDALLQRLMVSVVVNPDKVPGVNPAGATAFQQYLLTPTVQAKIRSFRPAGIEQQLWWPAARNNDPSVLRAP